MGERHRGQECLDHKPPSLPWAQCSNGDSAATAEGLMLVGPRQVLAYLAVMTLVSVFGIIWGLQRGGGEGSFVVACAVLVLAGVLYLYWVVIHKPNRR